MSSFQFAPDLTAVRFGFLAPYTSRVDGADLTAFYDQGGVPLTGDARAAVAALGLPAPTVDPSTLHE
ncbi:hypothetical protein AB0I55_07605 [Actinocatenispora sera]|uniref:hypothetical protein n=1 Tax=Actinocatenispora sera TaxID=390989 RepID=UPI0033D401A6